jgi:hypothetical protein
MKRFLAELRSRRRSVTANAPGSDFPAPTGLCDPGTLVDFRGLIVRLETAKGGHKVFDIAGRRRFAGFEVALNA